MSFAELNKIMVNKVTIVGFRGGNCGDRPPWIRPWLWPLVDASAFLSDKSLLWHKIIAKLDIANGGQAAEIVFSFIKYSKDNSLLDRRQLQTSLWKHFEHAKFRKVIFLKYKL